MKILPFNNTFYINKSHNYTTSFRGNSGTVVNHLFGIGSYIDDAGLHYVHNNSIPDPVAESTNDTFAKKSQQKNSNAYFITQEQYEKKYNAGHFTFKEQVMKALHDIDLESIEKILYNKKNSKYGYLSLEALREPFFLLGLAEIPLSNDNRSFFQKIVNDFYIINKVNIVDENGITLLEKIINGENDILLKAIIKHVLRDSYDRDLVYEPMQKYAFDNIRNPEFKKLCENDLPIDFPDIEEDIKNKDLFSLDKHVHEQMTCGFCSIDFALSKLHHLIGNIEKKYYVTKAEYENTYAKVVFDIIKKHFPQEVEHHIKNVIIK